MRKLFIAAGTSPNTIYEQGYPGTFRHGRQVFSALRTARNGDIAASQPMHDTPFLRSAGRLRSRLTRKDGKYMFLWRQPSRSTPAMSSRRWRAPRMDSRMSSNCSRTIRAARPTATNRDARAASFLQARRRSVCRRMSEVNRLTPTIIEVIVTRADGRAQVSSPASSTGCRILRAYAPTVEDTTLL